MADDKPGFPVSFLSQLRFPQLFVLLAILFVADLLVPDFIPLYDEVVLGLLTLMLGALRRGDRSRVGDAPEKPPEKNVTPRDG